MRFIKVNEIKSSKVELFKFFFHFMCVATHASELLCVAHLANIEYFLYHSITFYFNYQVLYTCKLASLS